MKIPATTERVTMHTDEETDRKIVEELECRLYYYLDHPGRIDDRLRALDYEWDMERALEAMAATFALAGLLMTLVKKRYVLFPMVVTGFLLQHALQGWCPPVPVLRRLGVRTQAEIELERYALKALRGDFDALDKLPKFEGPNRAQPKKVLQALTR